jgi:gliding motility-associated-like protein/uncharacterized repeat protein (TIGR01451 family)
MNHKILHRFASIFAGAVLALVPMSQVAGQTATYDPSVFISTDINSGNPTYPFPQFLEYKGGGKSLAKYNAEGVTHADMEKAMREAYQIMTHRCRYDGTYCGVKYINFNNNSVEGNYGTFCSEGDGYILLAAALFADQATFNGLYMWIHDNRFSDVIKFKDGQWLRKGAEFGSHMAGWESNETTPVGDGLCHSATDGDVDIAMAMLLAYKQWGDDMMQNGSPVKDFSGNTISYKKEAEMVIKALVDTIPQWDSGSKQISGYLCGDIGVDGYTKRGNSWGEATSWRFNQTTYPWATKHPNLYSIYGGEYVDYDAPSYYNEFWKWLSSTSNDGGEGTPWQISQFKRAEASADWLTGQAYAKGYNASIGQVSFGADNMTPTFSVYVDGEDFRYAWRHLLNYLWHGNPDYGWDPSEHQVVSGGNTYNHDMGVRHAKLLKTPSSSGSVICSKMGASPDPGQPKWQGVAQIPQQWAYNGAVTSAYHTNYSVGSGAVAAVVSEDTDLVADIYRQCEIMWDDNSGLAKFTNPEQRYLGSTPKYFHGWFRTLGMLVCSGNMPAPEDMKPIANMKVYMSVDKTYAYQGDDVSYTVQYRNYGSLDAKDVSISTTIDAKDYTFVSANKGGVYNASTHTITWNLGTVPGFKTGGLNATIDSVAFVVNIKDTINPRVCLVSNITCSNGSGWTSNEYPNHATYTMERNCVDVLAARSLSIKKTANRTSLNPNDVVRFTVEFENKSTSNSWLNGGRDNVRVSYGNYYMSGSAYQFYQMYRFWNDSYESYLNMHNYRVSYFMNDAAAQGLYDASTNPTGWTFVVDNQNDLDKYGYNPSTGPITFAYQKIPAGSDANGSWNQRLMIRFADVLMAPTTHVYDKLDSQYLLHKGVWGPGFIRARLASNPNADLTTRVKDDWSFSDKVKETGLDGQGVTFTLISPCWANYKNMGYPVTNYSRNVCGNDTTNFSRVLVEEFDGYTWRRILGTGPLPGKEAENVTVIDTIPYELQFVQFIDSLGLKVPATYTAAANPKSAGYTGIVKWTIPSMLVGEKDKLIYTCKARDLGCPDAVDTYYKNVAWISSKTDSPDSSQVDLMTSCSELPPVIDPQNCLTKIANVKGANVGDKVTYTVSYVNKNGTKVDANCTTQTGWHALGTGVVAAATASGMKLSTDGSHNYFFSPDKAYGKNGSVMLTIGGSPSSTQSLFLVMRYVSGTPGASNFKGVAIQLMVNKDGNHNFGYNLYNDGTLVKSEGLTWADALQFPGSATDVTFKFVLSNDSLFMYINDADDDWTAVSKSWTGLTSAGPGDFGMFTSSNGNSSTVLSMFKTSLDYAYDVVLSDQLPDELDNISNISDKGTWNKTTKEVVWPAIAGPIAPKDSFAYSFDAEVVSCNKYINNYAKAVVNSIDTFKTLNTISCGASACALDSAYIASTNKTRRFCATDSLVLKATPDPKGTYYYQFYKDGKSLGKMGKADSVIVRTAGVYKVTIYNTADTTCRKTSDTFEVWVDTVPATILTDTSACTGTSIALKATATSVKGYTYEWSDGSTASTLTVSKEGTYSVKVANGLCTVSDTATVRFGSVTLKGGIFTLNGKAYDRATSDTGSICADSSATLAMNYVADEGKYTWSSTPADASLTTGADGKSVSVSPKAATTYYVRFVQGCDAVDSFTVTIGKPMKVSVKTDTLCDSLQLTASTDAAVTATYAWSLGGDAVEGNPLLIDGTVYPKGTVSVTATAMGACPSEPLDIKYENVTMTLQVDGSPSVCPGKKAGIKALATTTGLAAPAYTYSWTDATGAAIGTTDSVNAGPGSYTLTAGNGYCHRTATHKITEGSGELKGDLTVNGTKVVGNPAKTYGSCGGPVDIVADYAHDAGTDFEWSVNGVVQSGTTSTLSLTPKAKTVVTLKFTNECSAYDTLTITMLDSVKIGTTSIIPECGKTSLTVSSAIPSGTRFSWYAAGDTISGKALTIGIADSTSGHGTVRLQGKAAGYCDSRVMDMTFTIDTLGVSLTALPTVCSGAPARLTAKAANTDPANKITYSYAQRKAGSTAAFTVITGASGATCETAALTEPTEFEVTATDGICTHTDTVTVGIGVPARDGHLTVDGITIDSVNAKGVKTYRTCGDGPLALSVTHKATDETSFSWTADSTDAGKGRDITVTPAATTQYVVSYVNGCPATDTVSIEVHPLAVSADWTAFGAELCEGSSASVPLTLTGYSAKDAGAYIRWYKDGKELAANDGAATLSLTGLKAADSGTYTYKVSNGVCTKPAAGAADSGKLTVKPYATVTAAATEYIVGRGNDTILTLATTPADASVAWYENSATGRTPAGTGNPYPLKDVQADHSLTAVASAIGYCPDSIGLGVLVDAKAVIRFRSAGDSICAGDALTLTADTTGTGKLLFPGKYEISYSLLATDGKYKSIQGSGATITVTPTLATTYKATVTYGSQTVSDTLRVTVFAKATYTLDYSKLICAGTASQITVNDLDPSDAQVAWNGDSTLSGDGKSVTVTPSESTTYSFTISQNGGACRQTVKVPVSTIAPVNIIMAADTAICQGDVIALTASVTGAPKFYRWTAAGSDSLLGVSPRVSVSPKSTTAYTLTAGNGVCDSATATITVKVNELPVIDSIVKTDVRTEKVLASGGSEPYQYAVAGGSYQSGDEITLPTYGAHVFHVLDANGCTASKLDTLVAPKIIVPVVVTPNGDGKNDVFTVPGLKEAYPDAKITIYDRWGKKLADYKASDGDWDGTYNGHQMPSTDYWYEISVDEIDKTYTGHFTLLRSK